METKIINYKEFEELVGDVYDYILNSDSDLFQYFKEEYYDEINQQVKEIEKYLKEQGLNISIEIEYEDDYIADILVLFNFDENTCKKLNIKFGEITTTDLCKNDDKFSSNFVIFFKLNYSLMENELYLKYRLSNNKDNYVLLNFIKNSDSQYQIEKLFEDIVKKGSFADMFRTKIKEIIEQNELFGDIFDAFSLDDNNENDEAKEKVTKELLKFYETHIDEYIEKFKSNLEKNMKKITKDVSTEFVFEDVYDYIEKKIKEVNYEVELDDDEEVVAVYIY